MSNVIGDVLTLCKIELPQSISRKRVIANFLALYTLSLKDKLLGLKTDVSTLSIDDVQPESKIWQSFYHIISMYVKYISPRYFLQTYIVRSVATAWHSKSYIDFLNQNFTEPHINKIPFPAREKVSTIAKAMTQEFAGLSYDVVNKWLQTYQYSLTSFGDNPEEMSRKINDTLVIELGAGTGANVCVLSSLSKKGVFIFDIPPMLKIQQQIIAKISKYLPLSHISYFSDPEALMSEAKKQPYIVVSYWAFTEFPEELRKTLDPLLAGAEFSLFACNSTFEGIDNLAYFKSLTERMPSKTVSSQIIDWNPYKKHSYVLVK